MQRRPKRDTRDKPAYDKVRAPEPIRAVNYFSPMVSRAAATTSGGSA
jgi:hypothetical protein